MELSAVDISQISAPEGMRLEQTAFRQFENQRMKAQETREKKKKVLQVVSQSCFRLPSVHKLLDKGKGFLEKQKML